MTKTEAIGVIKEFVAYGKHVNAFVYKGSTSIPIDALNMAIEALEQIESGRYIKGECSRCSEKFGTLGCCTTVSNHWVYSCEEGIAQYAEALEQNRPTAHWKDGKWCSNCGEGIPTEVWNGGVEKDEIKFCFSCGARMESDEE